MVQAWLFCGCGIIFCLTAIYIFYRNIYEKDRSIIPSILVMIMGVILIAVGTAKYVGLMN